MIIKIILLSTLLGISAISCTKDTALDGIPSQVENYLVTYSIDGESFYKTIHNKDEWSALLDNFLAMARKGHRITFTKGNQRLWTDASKEIKTFSTESKQEAIIWCNQMTVDGWTVTLEFDEHSGKYICTAIR